MVDGSPASHPNEMGRKEAEDGDEDDEWIAMLVEVLLRRPKSSGAFSPKCSGNNKGAKRKGSTTW